MKVKDVLENKFLVISPIFLEAVNKLDLDFKEFLFLIYYINENDKTFDVKKISDCVKISESDVLSSFNSLIKKKIIVVESKKNGNGKITEYINLDYFYNEIEEVFKKEKSKKKNDSIYSVFEKEFARPISSIEYEIIRAWLEKEFSEELILGALKEAVYNGVTNLRYIDKILYEWQKKGFKTMKEVNNHLTKRTKSKEENKELFDYNWLDEENN